MLLNVAWCILTEWLHDVRRTYRYLNSCHSCVVLHVLFFCTKIVAGVIERDRRERSRDRGRDRDDRESSKNKERDGRDRRRSRSRERDNAKDRVRDYDHDRDREYGRDRDRDRDRNRHRYWELQQRLWLLGIVLVVSLAFEIVVFCVLAGKNGIGFELRFTWHF